MRFESRVFALAKDDECPEENQDAWRTDSARGIAAIADGVASSIFAGPWARILTEATVAEPPDPDDREAFGQWLARRRESWVAEIDVADLAWHQKPKLREGAFSTLLWVEITPIDQTDRQPHDPWRLRAFAVGDSCLFHVRGKELLRTFPVEEAAELEADPVVIGSIDLNRDEMVAFESFEALCRPGDLLVLATDAVAEWAFWQRDAGTPPAWEDYWTKTDEAWQEEIGSLRHERQMRYDDATLLLLRVTDGVSVPESAEESTPGSQTTVEEQTGPSPLPEDAPPPEWARKLKSLSEQLADQVSDQLSRGTARLKEKLKEMKESAQSALNKYRDKPPDDDEPPPPDV